MEEMWQSGLQPDLITFSVLISACDRKSVRPMPRYAFSATAYRSGPVYC